MKKDRIKQIAQKAVEHAKTQPPEILEPVQIGENLPQVPVVESPGKQAAQEVQKVEPTEQPKSEPEVKADEQAGTAAAAKKERGSYKRRERNTERRKPEADDERTGIANWTIL